MLALCIDLEERLRHDAALYRRRPTRLTLTIKQPGTDPLPIPGNNYTEGGSKSRSVPFPAPRPSPPDESAALVKLICGGVSSESVDVPDDAYGRIHALVDAVATALEGWSREQGNPRVAHLSLAAGHFDSGPAPVPITALFKPSPKKKKRPAPARPPPASPSFAGIDGADVDPATLSELPPAVRADVERQMRLWEGSRKRPGGASPSPPATPRLARKKKEAEPDEVAEDHGLPPAIISGGARARARRCRRARPDPRDGLRAQPGAASARRGGWRRAARHRAAAGGRLNLCEMSPESSYAPVCYSPG